MKTNIKGSPATAVESSVNIKVGPSSATWVSQHSCPNTCPLKGKGCYAESGRAAFVTRRLNASTESDQIEIAQAEAAGIRSLSGRNPLRLHVVGDCATDEAAKIVSAAAIEHTAKYGQPAWTYTHAHNVSRESWGTVSVLRSCETHEQVVKAMEEGFAAAVIVEEFESDKPYAVGDTTYFPCPEQTGTKPNCITCGLCMKDSKLRRGRTVIAFKAHGTRRNTVLRVLNGTE